MQSMVTGLVLLCSAPQAPTGTETVRAQYRALLEEYEAADREWNKVYDATVRPPAKVDWEARYRANPLWSFVPRFMVGQERRRWTDRRAVERTQLADVLYPRSQWRDQI